MIVFGGIFEVTKELDDMVVLDFRNRRWVTFFDELGSPVKQKRDNFSRDNSPFSK
jgi:hypothetical protein